ncbi:MAG TPA: hypothetical protein VFQ91_02620 [Bryobacteraceae bacterium]|nr:hypothetical protein [Bryobacteraceae bacterium]
MDHVSEEQLVLLYYGEPGVEETRAHVEACAACRTDYQAVQRLLNTMDAGAIPERDADYGQRVWASVSARARVRRYAWRTFGALAAGLLVGIALHFSVSTEPTEPVTAQADEQSGRVLEAALESHLESSRLVLTEIVNNPGDGWSRESAEDLLADNRLYRQTAEATGQTETERLLEDLEEVLVEVAHAPAGSEELRRRIETKGVLFAIQVRTTREGIL